jgi:hypothetical protein
MNRLTKIAIAATFALALAPLVSAHEGHDHKIMGTVAAVHDTSVDVKGADGKTSTVTLNDKTKILQGTTAVKAVDIKEGTRVVITATGGGKDPFVAKEVRIAVAKTAPTTPKKTVSTAPKK